MCGDGQDGASRAIYAAGVSKPWYAEVPVERWAESLRAADRAEARVWFVDWVEGRLDRFAPDEDLLEWDRRMGALFTEVDGERDFDIEYEREGRTERELRRWCWAEGWLQMSQDEDLLLMDADQAPPLLDEARRGCPKRDYILGIVEHGLRDAFHRVLCSASAVTPRDPDRPDLAKVRARLSQVYRRATESPRTLARPVTRR